MIRTQWNTAYYKPPVLEIPERKLTPQARGGITKSQRLDNEAIDALKDCGWITTREAATKMGKDKVTMLNRLRRLHADGRVLRKQINRPASGGLTFIWRAA